MFWKTVGENLWKKLSEVIIPAFLLGAGAAVAITAVQLAENFFLDQKTWRQRSKIEYGNLPNR